MDIFLHWLALADQPQHVLTQSIFRLLLAAILGGCIGFQRERRGKAAGLRTNMLICVGSATFTILSLSLASTFGGDRTRIAAQIISGIGFIGAGSILRERGSITGLTTAATMFVAAGVGMAAGGGMPVLAMFTTVLVLLALSVLGRFETQRLKLIPARYSLVGNDIKDIISVINTTLSGEHRLIKDIRLSSKDGHSHALLRVDATQLEHEQILRQLEAAPRITQCELRTGPAFGKDSEGDSS
ncbi:MAG: MgtC/SapB family protein [Candidatus Korobacteraceae bacterium]|jgi:putative Mg2+ transporter-C (MgtC) family protein